MIPHEKRRRTEHKGIERHELGKARSCFKNKVKGGRPTHEHRDFFYYPKGLRLKYLGEDMNDQIAKRNE